MKTSLILEELSWFNLVNGSGNLPTIDQVTFSYLDLETPHSLSSQISILFEGGQEETVHEACNGKQGEAGPSGRRTRGWLAQEKQALQGAVTETKGNQGETKGKPRGMN